MNQYNSYYLYQQYEKRGSQDWLPCYPNIFSVDGDGTMPLVMKKENDPDCGYTGDTQPIYRWYPLPITTDYICDECPVVQYRWENMNPSTDYYCDGTTKYYKQIRQYSYDSGTTWYDVVPPEYQQGSVYEQQSTDCGYVPPIEPQYRTTSGTPYCEGYDKYIDIYSQVSYDGGITWSTTATTPTLVEHNSAQCGYIEPQYRTTSGTPYCSGETGYDKYVTVYSEVSYDGGITWEVTATTQTLLEHNSADCGYTPKFLGTYSNGTTKRVECESGGNHMLTRGTVQVTGTSLVSAEVGNCIYVIDSYCFGDSQSLTSVTFTDELTGINQSAFSGCTSLSSITIPSGVTLIAQYAFQGCTSLTGITIPKSVESIPNTAFSGCTGMTSLVFEEGSKLTALTNYSFAGCKSLTGVTIPSGITTMGAAFNDCTSLSSVTFENNSQLTTIDGFGGCTSLTGITIPSSVTTVKNSAFSICRSLTSIDIPAGVTNIGNQAFRGCSGLTGVTVNATTPPTLGTTVFDNTNNCPIYVPCNSASAYRAATNWSAYASRIHGIQPCQETYKLVASYSNGDSFSAVCDSNTTLTSGDTKPTGYTYSAMTSAVIGDCINQIADGAFAHSTLTSVTIPSSVTGICCYAFDDCSGLTSIAIPSSVTNITNHAFAGCNGFTSIGVVGSGASVEIPSSVTNIGSYAFTVCRGLTSIDIPGSVTSIDNGAFFHSTSITSCTMGNGVTTIGFSAFEGCSGLTSIEIPASVTSIGDQAFYECSGLTSITCNATTPPTLGNNQSAFSDTNNCPIYVPCESVTTYKSSWSNYSSRIRCTEQYRTTSGTPYCDGVDKYVDVYSQISYDGGTTWETTATTTTLVEHNSQDCGYMTRTISGTPYCDGNDKYVETFDQVSYDSGETWATTSSAITLVELDSPDCITPQNHKIDLYYSNDTHYYLECDADTELTSSDTKPAGYTYQDVVLAVIGDCITGISTDAFYDFNIVSIAIPSGVTSIGAGAFRNCDSLTSITVDSSNAMYDSRNNCNAIIKTNTNELVVGCSNTTIPNSVTSIGRYAFYYINLTGMTIPNSVTSIGESAFVACLGLTNLVVPDSVTSIGDYAFYTCRDVTAYTIGTGVTSIGDYAFCYGNNLSSITVNATTPPTLGGIHVFNNTNDCPIYVPSNKLSTYQSSWSRWKSRLRAIP